MALQRPRDRAKVAQKAPEKQLPGTGPPPNSFPEVELPESLVGPLQTPTAECSSIPSPDQGLDGRTASQVMMGVPRQAPQARVGAPMVDQWAGAPDTVPDTFRRAALGQEPPVAPRNPVTGLPEKVRRTPEQDYPIGQDNRMVKQTPKSKDRKLNESAAVYIGQSLWSSTKAQMAFYNDVRMFLDDLHKPDMDPLVTPRVGALFAKVATDPQMVFPGLRSLEPAVLGFLLVKLRENFHHSHVVLSVIGMAKACEAKEPLVANRVISWYLWLVFFKSWMDTGHAYHLVSTKPVEEQNGGR